MPVRSCSTRPPSPGAGGGSISTTIRQRSARRRPRPIRRVSSARPTPRRTVRASASSWPGCRAGSRCRRGATPSGSRPPSRPSKRVPRTCGVPRCPPRPAAAAAPSCWCGCRPAGTCRVIVVRHRISDPGEGAVTSPGPGAVARCRPPPIRRAGSVRSRATCCGWPTSTSSWPCRAGIRRSSPVPASAGSSAWTPTSWCGTTWPTAGARAPGRACAPRSPSTGARFADRIAVAEAARGGRARAGRAVAGHGVPALPVVAALRGGARRRRRRQPGRARRGRPRCCARSASPRSRSWRELDAAPAGCRSRCPLRAFADLVALARARRSGLSVVRRVPRVPVRRADVEVDVDMESFGESGAYMWGTLLSLPRRRPRRATSRPGTARSPRGTRCPRSTRRRSFARVLAVVHRRARPRRRHRPHASPRTATTSRRRTAGCSIRRDRFAGVPGRPESAARWRRSSPIRAGSTSTPSSTSGSSARRQGPQADRARRPGSPGTIPRPAGRTRCAGTATPSGSTASRPIPAQRERLLAYNADDVAATHALREWMTSPAVEEVPLAADL